ncbi:MAG TPA: GDSL-type esterase/lipase family protein [Capsulimonadaceae bacterium]|jgi:hypothetical protein
MNRLAGIAAFAIATIVLPALVDPASAAPLTKGVAVRVMPVGDSITEGKPVTAGGYRGVLQGMLKDAGFPVVFVGKEDNGEPANATGFSVGLTYPNHEGYGSFTIDQMMNGGSAEGHSAPAIEATLDADKPDVALIMLGTNDLIQKRDLGGILGRLDSLTGRILKHSPKVKIVLAAPTPMAGERGATAAVYASGVPLVVEKYKALGNDITFVNMNTALKMSDLPDSVHPNERGYAKMANVWFQALTGIAPKPIVDDPMAGAPAGDLAFNKPWTCSDPNRSGWSGLTDGIWGEKDPACFATDQADTFPKTVTIDLQQPTSISSVITGTLPATATKTVEVSVSQSAETGFTKVGSHVFVQNQDEKYTYSFPPVTARFVRLTFADHYAEGAYSPLFVFLKEVEVYAPAGTK